jgi:ABC-2 type transport system permease protein
MNAFAIHFSFDFRTGIRNKTLLLMNYLFPLGFFLMMGAIMPGLNPFFLEVMIPAMVVFAVLAATLLGLPEPLVTAREVGVFRSYKINGVPSISILTIPALTTALHLVIVAAIITVSAPLLFDAPLPVNWAGYGITLFAITVASSGIAVLIGVVSADSRIQVLWSQLIFLPSMLLGGMMIRYADLPEAAARFAQLLPATHAMNAFNALAMGQVADFSAWGSVIALLVSGVLGFALAVYLFTWDSNTKRRGHPALALLVLAPFVVMMLL